MRLERLSGRVAIFTVINKFNQKKFASFRFTLIMNGVKLFLLNRIMTSLAKERRWIKYLVRTIWIFVLGFLIAFPLYIYAVIENPFNWFGPLPSLKAIENPENDLSSEVISADGVSLGRYFRFGTNRSQVTYDQLSKDLIHTLIYSEDHRFYQHSGMDLWAYFRVLKGLLTLDPQGGGSTLTQQTAKNLFSTRSDELRGRIPKQSRILDLIISKTKEWIIAFRLEQTFTKEEILALYLNTVSFNNNAFGIKVAAETYFGKQPSELNITESALLVGMLQGTTIFNPVVYPERALKKRNEVIAKLYKHQYVKTTTDRDSLQALPLQLQLNISNQNEGIAQHFRNVLKNELIEWCDKNGYDLFESGLKIYTSIDSRMQHFAEEAVRDHMKILQRSFDDGWGKRNPWRDANGSEISHFAERKIKNTDLYRQLTIKYGEKSEAIENHLNQKRSMRVFSYDGEIDTVMSAYDSIKYYNRFLQCGLMAMDPCNGAIRAWVGGIDFQYFQFDHVKQALRQPGSTFKPFVYGRAMEVGYSPCQTETDLSPALTINGHLYQVKNANGTFGDGQEVTLRQALARSLNTVTMKLMDKLTPEKVVDFAHRQGIQSSLVPVHSLALGTSDVSLFELVGAYGTFVNHGNHTKPLYISRIEDRHGNTIARFTPITRQGTDEMTAMKIIHLLKGGVEEEGGSSRGLNKFVLENNEVGGKTGTTDDGSDGWYVGVTPNLVTGVWVGGDERSIRFPYWGEGSGARTALPIWDKFMTKVYQHPETGYTKGSFDLPLDALDMTFDCEKHEKPRDYWQDQ